MVEGKTGEGEAVNCERVWREISNYVDGEVDPTLRSALEEHFHTCPRCTSVLAGVRNVTRIYGDERMLELPAGFSRRLEKRLAQDVRERERRWSTWSAWLVPLAALALLAGGVRVANSLTFEPALKSEHAQPGHNVPPDMVVVVATGTKLFHVAGCDVIHNKDRERTLTAKEAMQQGYTPCARCLRKYLEVGGVQASAADDGDGDQEVRVARH
jgi:hypothetical protein